jgi:2-phosphosulfolactate phosphatase
MIRLLLKGFIFLLSFIIQSENSLSTEQRESTETRVVVVIDVFRAFTTACYVLEQKPSTYILTTKSDVVSRLAPNALDTITIGKAEMGAVYTYDIPNSPTRVKEIKITNKTVLHRTEAGAKGVLFAQDADIILAAGFVNADATARYIKMLQNPRVRITPMGHEATTPSLEDDICAKYIETQLSNGQQMDLSEFRKALQEGPGNYFFSDDQWQYPREDFECCLETGRFDFAIQAEVLGDYATLRCCK